MNNIMALESDLMASTSTAGTPIALCSYHSEGKSASVVILSQSIHLPNHSGRCWPFFSPRPPKEVLIRWCKLLRWSCCGVLLGLQVRLKSVTLACWVSKELHVYALSIEPVAIRARRRWPGNEARNGYICSEQGEGRSSSCCVPRVHEYSLLYIYQCMGVPKGAQGVPLPPPQGKP